MPGYKLLRNSYELEVTSGAIDDEFAKGSAVLEFIGGTLGYSTDLPAVGDHLRDLSYYVSGGSSIVYLCIDAKSIKQVPYHYQGEEKWKYTVSYNSEDSVNSEFFAMQSTPEAIVSVKPSYWRYGSTMDDDEPPVGVGGITGSLEGKIRKIVVTGTFKQRKIVHKSWLDTFFNNYKAIAGKLNVQSEVVFFEEDGEGSYSIEFKQGQLLIGAMDNGSKRGDGKYIFEITFAYRIIGDKNGPRSEDITDNDWQYVLADQVQDAGWMIPVRVSSDTGTGATSPVTEPFVYRYVAIVGDSNALRDFIDFDYSET